MQICTSRAWGGMEMHVRFLSKHLADRGHKIVPLCSPGSPLEQDFKEHGFEPLSLELGGYFHPRGIAKLSDLLQEWEVDIVHSHYSRDLWTIAPALSLNKKLSRVPLILTKHIGTQKPKRDFLHKKIYRRVDHIIAISDVIQKNLIATHPITPNKVSVVHHGVDFSEFSSSEFMRNSARDELGYTKGHIVFGIIGRLQISKGYLEFLEMASRIIQVMPAARFLIIGEATRGEPEEGRLIHHRIQQLNLNAVTKCMGFRKDVARMLSAMDIFIFPSHAEAFGLALIEAMAMGIAVVSSNCDGVLDIVQDGENGFLVSPRDVDGLTKTALNLAHNAETRKHFGEAGQRHVARFFSLKKSIDNIETIYKHVTETRKIS